MRLFKADVESICIVLTLMDRQIILPGTYIYIFIYSKIEQIIEKILTSKCLLELQPGFVLAIRVI